MNTLETALDFHRHGIAAVPATDDGMKRPALKGWKQFQTQTPDPADFPAWFTGTGIGVITGAVSGGLEMAEIEGRTGGVQTILDLTMIANQISAGGIWERVCNGWVERSPSGGIHWFYRITDAPVPGNQKIASRPATPEELAVSPKAKQIVLAETRGEGGFVVTAPSHGYVHESGAPWTRLQGGPETVPALTMEERDAFLDVLRTLDQTPFTAPTPPDQMQRWIDQNPGKEYRENGISPLDGYEKATDWADILDGWTLVFTQAGTRYWRRPGKRQGISATTGHAEDRERLYVFSTNTEFQAEVPYTKPGAYAVLHHGGDHKAAAAALSAYKEPARIRTDSPIKNQPATTPETHGSLALVTDISEKRKPKPERTLEQSDDGNALALIIEHGASIRYSPERGRWLYWTGNRWTWQPAGGGMVREKAKEISRGLPDGDGYDRHKKYSLSAVGISNMLTQAATDPRISVTIAELDSHPWELNTPGGIINLRTGELMPPDPLKLHTRMTGCTPDFDADPAVWTKFLHDAFPDYPELIGYIQRLLGYSAIGEVLEHILPFCHGGGGNGKGVTLEVAQAVFGDYATSAPNGFLMAQKFPAHLTEIADLAGARFVICSEVNKDDKFDEAKVKLLTGGDTLKARFMAKDLFKFRPSHHLWLMGNHQPGVEAGGDSFWRRLRLIPFVHKVPDDEVIPDLPKILIRDHGPAILAWIIQGAAEYARDGLKEPAQVKTATAAYAADIDTVGRFLDDECWTGPAARDMSVRVTQLRAAYESWCQENGETPVTGRAFTTQLAGHGVRTGKDAPKIRGHRAYGGIGLKADEEG